MLFFPSPIFLKKRKRWKGQMWIYLIQFTMVVVRDLVSAQVSRELKLRVGQLRQHILKFTKKGSIFNILQMDNYQFQPLFIFFQEEHLSFQTVVPYYLCSFLKTLFVRQKVCKDWSLFIFIREDVMFALSLTTCLYYGWKNIKAVNQKTHH